MTVVRGTLSIALGEEEAGISGGDAVKNPRGHPHEGGKSGGRALELIVVKSPGTQKLKKRAAGEK